MSNVINFMDYYKNRRRDQQNVESDNREEILEAAPVLDMTESRKLIMQNERRVVKRTILTEFIGAFAILPERGLCRVGLFDISDKGLAFDIPTAEGQYQKGDEIAMRIYLNHKTYFPFVVKITYSRSREEDGMLRHGANFVDGTINDVALHHFIKFIENISASLKTDNGDIQVSHIS
ncbi:MAG: PilZ domain-containing protein [Bdellovibrionota bacterium]